MAPSNSKRNSGKNKNKPKSSPNNPNSQSESVPNESPIPSYESRTRDLAWLSDAFSSLSMIQIESAYDETGHDAFKAAGILGTQMEMEDEDDPSVISTISELSSFDPSSGSTFSESSSSSSDPGIRPTVCEGSPSRRKGKKARPKNTAMSCGMVSNVIGKGYMTTSNENSTKMEGKRGANWDFEEAEGFLCSMLGDGSELDLDVVRDVLGQCGGYVEKALEVLLELSDCSHNQKINEKNFANNSRSCLDYSIIFGTKRNPNSYQLTNKQSSSTYEYERQTRPEMQQKVLESLFHMQEQPKYKHDSTDWRSVVKKLQYTGEEPRNIHSQSIRPIQQTTQNGTVGNGYHEFRTIAQRNWAMMKECYQRAATEYTRGNRSHATILAEKGKYYRDMARQEDEKASLEIFGARNRDIKNTVTIDLHGQHVKQAIGLLKRHLLSFACVPSVHNLRVITGCSMDGVGKGKLKRSVINLVERENLEWMLENPGAVILNIQGKKEYSFTDSDSDCEP